MSDVFISFIHEEEEIAKAVQRFLQAHLNGRGEVFLSSDQWAIYAGEQWLERIISELRQAKVVVSLFSSTSVKRPWVNFEAGAAWIRESTALIPVCFAGMTKGNMPKPYSSLQAVQLKDFDDQYYLLTSVLHYLNRSTPPPPPPFSLVETTSDENSPIAQGQRPYRELQEALEKFDASRKRKHKE